MSRVMSESFEARILERVLLLLMKRRAQCQHYRMGMSLSWIPPNNGKRVGRGMPGDQHSQCFLSRISCSHSLRWRETNLRLSCWDSVVAPLRSNFFCIQYWLSTASILLHSSSSGLYCFAHCQSWVQFQSPSRASHELLMDAYSKLSGACEPPIHKRETLLPHHGRDWTALPDSWEHFSPDSSIMLLRWALKQFWKTEDEAIKVISLQTSGPDDGSVYKKREVWFYCKTVSTR